MVGIALSPEDQNIIRLAREFDRDHVSCIWNPLKFSHSGREWIGELVSFLDTYFPEKIKEHPNMDKLRGLAGRNSPLLDLSLGEGSGFAPCKRRAEQMLSARGYNHVFDWATAVINERLAVEREARNCHLTHKDTNTILYGGYFAAREIEVLVKRNQRLIDSLVGHKNVQVAV